jgi:hypothetical protein
MNTEKITDEKFIKIVLTEDNIEVSVRYSKRTTLQSRFEMIERLKKVMRDI